MDSNSKILIVDDDEMLCSYVEDALSVKGFNTFTAPNIHEAKRIVQKEPIDLLITDIQMKGGSGIDLVRYFRSDYPSVPAIVITGFPGEEYIKVFEEMEVDAFLTKPFSIEQIRYSVLKGLEKRKRDIEQLGIEDHVSETDTLGLIGTSQYIVKMRKKIRDLAKGEFPVLIQGPSGTGKEIIANGIHKCSTRRKNHIVTINCAAIPKDLEESEFFGHTKGAFTGAYRDKNGIIAAADNSTLFLDEVGELSLGVQAKLLRVLENGEFLRIGETEPRKVDIRIITATNQHLKEMVAQGSFREDLFFRLGIILSTRPLQDHTEDIPPIVRYLIDVNVQKDTRYPNQITSEAMAYLVDQHWAGNIRELKQTLSLLCHTAIGKKRINMADVLTFFEKGDQPINIEASYSDEKEKILKDFEIEYFTKLLKKYSGNISQAAKASGMHRPNLLKKLKSIGISADEFRISS